MKAILLDDDRLALHYLEQQLLQIGGVEVIGKYADPFKAEERMKHEQVDVVFMDINMPGISGLKLAEQIMKHKPELLIVFVTGYMQYALKAFELNVLDYIVKPYNTERLSKTIMRISESRGNVAKTDSLSTTHPIRMNVLRQVLIEYPEQQFETMHWRTSKAQELFFYFLQHRGQLIRKSVLIELLWPEFDPSKVYSQLYTAVYHIRKSMETYGDRFQIINMTEGYIMYVDNIILDVQEWEDNVQSAPPVSATTINHYLSLMDQYRGDYLQELDYWWAENERSRLKRLWFHLAHQIAEWYVENNQAEKAIQLYLDILKRYPQEEQAHFALMKIYDSLNQNKE